MLLPDLSASRRSVVEQMSLVDSSGLLASGSESTGLTVLVHRVDNPVVSGVTSDGLVLGIDKDDLKVLVSGILVHPVRVENSEVRSTSGNSLLSGSTQRSLVLELVNTHVGGLTVGSSLGHRSLSVSTSHTDTVDDKTLLGLVTETSSLVGTRRTRGTVDHVELTVLPAADAKQESHHIRLLVAGNLLQVLVGSHFVVVLTGV